MRKHKVRGRLLLLLLAGVMWAIRRSVRVRVNNRRTRVPMRQTVGYRV